MAKKTDNEMRTDDLLKQALKDDLPPDVESRMKVQISRFQEKVVRDKGLSAQAFSRGWKNFFQLKWAVRREVLAFSSLIMIVIGGFLHVSGHRSAVAEMKTTRDFGQIVYLMIEHKWMSAQPTDSIEDFDDVYDFDVIFKKQFKF